MAGGFYNEQLCVNDRCVYLDVFNGMFIWDDGWLLHQKGTYGILGFGPGSPIWYSYIDPETLTASYSV